jgi:hypothetical protein
VARTHGLSGSAEYRCYTAMKQRCLNKKCTGYHYYGAKGIEVHPDWLGKGGFERFVAHIGRRPSRDHSIDRVNGKRGYEPGNVRWATRAEQLANRDTGKGEAKRALRFNKRVLSLRDMEKLCRETRDALIAEFGPPRNDLKPSDFVVEQAYWDCDYRFDSEHIDGISDLKIPSFEPETGKIARRKFPCVTWLWVAA